MAYFAVSWTLSLVQIRVNDDMLGDGGRTRRWVWVSRMRAAATRDETEMACIHKPALWIAFRGVARGARRSRYVPVFHPCARRCR